MVVGRLNYAGFITVYGEELRKEITGAEEVADAVFTVHCGQTMELRHQLQLERAREEMEYAAC